MGRRGGLQLKDGAVGSETKASETRRNSAVPLPASPPRPCFCPSPPHFGGFVWHLRHPLSLSLLPFLPPPPIHLPTPPAGPLLRPPSLRPVTPPRSPLFATGWAS